MSQLAVMALGSDRPGIVAAVTAVLAEHDLNIEDSQMTVLRGHFTMMLVVGGADGADRAAVEGDLRAAGHAVGLDLVEVHPIADLGDAEQPEATHILTVYGVDHPGIVHAIAFALGERAVNIVDLNTRLVLDDEGGGEQPLYVMMLEVQVPAGMRIDALETALGMVADEQGVEISLRELEDN